MAKVPQPATPAQSGAPHASVPHAGAPHASGPHASARGAYRPRIGGTIKEAQLRLIEAVGGAKRAGDLVERGKTTMHRYGDDSEEGRGHHLAVDMVRDLEARADYPHVTAFLAAEAGCVLLPAAPLPAGVDLIAELARSARETADVTGALAGSLEPDGRGRREVTPREAGNVIREIDQAQAALAALRLGLVAIRDAT